MEQKNIQDMLRTIDEDKDGKVFRLLDFSENPKDIADPWYTGNFQITYDDVKEGCTKFLEYLLKEKE